MTARVAACARNVWKCRLIINLAINLIAAYSNKTQFQFFSLDHKVTLKSLPDTNPGIVMILESLNYPLVLPGEGGTYAFASLEYE